MQAEHCSACCSWVLQRILELIPPPPPTTLSCYLIGMWSVVTNGLGSSAQTLTQLSYCQGPPGLGRAHTTIKTTPKRPGNAEHN